MRRRIIDVVPFAPLMLCVTGCGSTEPDQQLSIESLQSEPQLKHLQTLDHNLVPGSGGDGVRAVHGYLARYGYFRDENAVPSEPTGRPVIRRVPANAAVYDERTADAVRQLQVNLGLPVTGIVDEKTRDALQKPRCGTPDELPLRDQPNSFSLDTGSGQGIPQPYATYWFNAFGEWSDRITNAISTWGAETTQVISLAGEANLNVFFDNTLPDEAAGRSGYSGNGYFHIRLHPYKPWYTGASQPVPDNTLDFQSVILHELGHVMGLGHSSFENAVMYPIQNWRQKRELDIDDKVAISKRRDVFEQLEGWAEDIGVNPVQRPGLPTDVWIIGTNYAIYKWDGARGWQHDSANGDARAIAVGPDGIPYVAAPWGVYRRTSTDPAQGTWQKINGACASDIGVGTEPHNPGDPVVAAVWMVGCDNNVYKTDGLWWYLDTVFPQHTATRIAVDTSGLPWVVSTAGVVYRRATTDPYSGYYVDLPAELPYATDIGVGPCCYAWQVKAQNSSINLFQYQPAAMLGNPYPAAYWRWLGFPSSGFKIAVGPEGEPWWVDPQKRIYHSTR